MKIPIISSLFIEPQSNSNEKKTKTLTQTNKSKSTNSLKRKRSKSISSKIEENFENATLDSENHIESFFKKFLSGIKNLSLSTLDIVTHIYFKLLAKEEKILKIKRDFSIKALKFLFSVRGILIDSKRKLLKQDIRDLKWLLFLYDLLKFKNNEQEKFYENFTFQNKMISISEFILSLKEISFFPENPDVSQFLKNKISNINQNLQNMNMTSSIMKVPPLEFSLIPIFIYFAFIEQGYPIIPIDLVQFINQGKLPYYEGFSLANKYTPTNLPSIQWIYKTINMFFKLFEEENLNLDKYEKNLIKRIFRETELPQIFEPIYLELNKNIKKHRKQQDLSIFLCSQIILMIKMVYGLNGEGYTCLLNPSDFKLLEERLPLADKENIEKMKEILEAYNKLDKWVKFMQKMPSLDSLIKVLKSKIFYKHQKNKLVFIYQYDDLKAIKGEENLSLILQKTKENSTNSQETNADFDIQYLFSLESYNNNLEVNFNNTSCLNCQKGEEKKALNPFLKEEFKFLLDNCRLLTKENLKKTVIPLPAAHYLHRKNYLMSQENIEFCVFLNFYSFFLKVDIGKLLSALKNQEKLLLNLKFN